MNLVSANKEAKIEKVSAKDIFVELFGNNEDEETKIKLFNFAAKSGNEDLCRSVMDQLEDKNPKNEIGRTPFHIAAEFGHTQICKLIMDKIKDKGKVMYIKLAQGFN